MDGTDNVQYDELQSDHVFHDFHNRRHCFYWQHYNVFDVKLINTFFNFFIQSVDTDNISW